MDFEKFRQHKNAAGLFAQQIGVELTRIGAGFAEGKLVVQPQHLNPRGTVHGGCLFTLLDTLAGTAAEGHGSPVATSSANIMYLRPAVGSRWVCGTAKEVSAGRNLMVYDTEAFDDAGRLVAKAMVTVFRLEGVIEF